MVNVKKGDWILIDTKPDCTRSSGLRYTICKVEKAGHNKIWGEWIGKWCISLKVCIDAMKTPLVGAHDTEYFADISNKEITILPKNMEKREEFLVQKAVLEAL